jgi:hypothetical protein
MSRRQGVATKCIQYIVCEINEVETKSQKALVCLRHASSVPCPIDKFDGLCPCEWPLGGDGDGESRGKCTNTAVLKSSYGLALQPVAPYARICPDAWGISPGRALAYPKLEL